jgi:hypothetical protein
VGCFVLVTGLLYDGFRLAFFLNVILANLQYVDAVEVTGCLDEPVISMKVGKEI